MRGVFVAAGPAFRDDGSIVTAFENVHVYNAVAIAIGVTPPANDGDPAVARRLLRRAVGGSGAGTGAARD
jgi:hypothetical protein